jgi:peroxiredoxin
LRIQSPENAAWTAYRNTMALHRQTLTQRIQEADVTTEALEANVRRTTSVLWSLRDSYTGTLGAAQATTESLALLEGWNDSLVVARARQIEPSSPGYVEAARIARRAQARRAGQAAALQLVRTYQKQAQTDEQRAALQAELVRTHIDSLNADSALAAAQTLRRQYADSDWAEWAERARYEVENLLPGRPAPGFTARTMSGDTLTLDRLRGRPVMLEFYRPESRQYRGQLAARNALYEATRPDSLALVSVSLQPDTLLNEAFFEGRDVPGQHVIAPDGMEGALAEKYNIATTPTRFLIGADGRIIDKYVGAGFARLRDRAAALNRGPDAASDTSAASPPAAPAPDPAPPSRRP